MTTPDALRAALAEALAVEKKPDWRPGLLWQDVYEQWADAILAHPAVAAALDAMYDHAYREVTRQVAESGPAAGALRVALANYDDDPSDIATQGVIGTARALAGSGPEPNWSADVTGHCPCGGQCHHNGRPCSESCVDANERAGSGPEAGLREAVIYGYQRGEADERYGRGHREQETADNFIGELDARAALAATPTASPTDAEMLRAALAVNLRVPIAEVDDWARRLVEADGRTVTPWLAASPTDPKHRPGMIDDVPTGFCECGLIAGHAASPTATGEREP